MPDVIARLRELERAADLDPLESTHIISPGYTHLANLTERILEGGKGGRGRCIAMIPKEWSDYIAAGMCALPALLDALEALTFERSCVDMDGFYTNWELLSEARRVTDAALKRLEETR